MYGILGDEDLKKYPDLAVSIPRNALSVHSVEVFSSIRHGSSAS